MYFKKIYNKLKFTASCSSFNNNKRLITPFPPDVFIVTIAYYSIIEALWINIFYTIKLHTKQNKNILGLNV